MIVKHARSSPEHLGGVEAHLEADNLVQLSGGGFSCRLRVTSVASRACCFRSASRLAGKVEADVKGWIVFRPSNMTALRNGGWLWAGAAGTRR